MKVFLPEKTGDEFATTTRMGDVGGFLFNRVFSLAVGERGLSWSAESQFLRWSTRSNPEHVLSRPRIFFRIPATCLARPFGVTKSSIFLLSYKSMQVLEHGILL